MTVFDEYLPNLHITHTLQHSTVLVTVSGEVDIGTVCLLEKGLTAARERALPAQAMVVDLRQVRFFGAAGVTALVRTDSDCRQQGVALRIVAGQRAVLRPLEIVGLLEAFRPTPEIGPEWTRQGRMTRASRAIFDAARRILLLDRHATTTKHPLALVDSPRGSPLEAGDPSWEAGKV